MFFSTTNGVIISKCLETYKLGESDRESKTLAIETKTPQNFINSFFVFLANLVDLARSNTVEAKERIYKWTRTSIS